MTGTDILNYIRADIEFLKNDEYTAKKIEPAYILSIVNRAQSLLCAILPRRYLHELDTVVLAITLDSDGKYDLSSLTDKPYYGGEAGIDAVRITDGDYCHKLSPEEYRDAVGSYEKLSRYVKPVYWFQRGYIYVYPSTSTVELYYMKRPTTMTEAATCSFSDELLHGLILLAETLILQLAVPRNLNLLTVIKAQVQVIGGLYTDWINGIIGKTVCTDSVYKKNPLYSGNEGDIYLKTTEV